MRLINSPENPYYKALGKSFVQEPRLALDPRGRGNENAPWVEDGDYYYPCDRGNELGGRLGLKEALATSAITANMNDVTVFQPPGSTVIHGVPVNLGQGGASQYTLGPFSTQIDFTITAGISGGSNWTLSHFQGPSAGGGSGGGGASSGGGSGGSGGGSSGGSGGGDGGSGGGGSGGGGSGRSSSLANLTRQTKDTVVVTFIPVCIRQEYFPRAWLTGIQCNGGGRICTGQVTPPKDGKLSYPLEYMRWMEGAELDPATGKGTPVPANYDRKWEEVQSMGVGTPGWANYLPPCNSPAGIQSLLTAPARGYNNNLSVQGIQLLQSLQ
jgi:hypothetical protein